jgi:hypothetical protein
MRCAEGQAHLPVGARMNCKFITCNDCKPLNTTSLEVTQLCLVEQAHQHTTSVQHLEHLGVQACRTRYVQHACATSSTQQRFYSMLTTSISTHHPLWTTHNSPALTTHNPPLCSATPLSVVLTPQPALEQYPAALCTQTVLSIRHYAITLWNPAPLCTQTGLSMRQYAITHYGTCG